MCLLLDLAVPPAPAYLHPQLPCQANTQGRKCASSNDWDVCSQRCPSIAGPTVTDCNDDTLGGTDGWCSVSDMRASSAICAAGFSGVDPAPLFPGPSNWLPGLVLPWLIRRIQLSSAGVVTCPCAGWLRGK